jgi:hypothetical protein
MVLNYQDQSPHISPQENLTIPILEEFGAPHAQLKEKSVNLQAKFQIQPEILCYKTN